MQVLIEFATASWPALIAAGIGIYEVFFNKVF